MITISSDVIRGYNDTIILYLLLDNPSYGYEISKQIKTLSAEKYIIMHLTAWKRTAILNLFRTKKWQVVNAGHITVLPMPDVNTIGKNVRNGS